VQGDPRLRDNLTCPVGAGISIAGGRLGQGPSVVPWRPHWRCSYTYRSLYWGCKENSTPPCPVRFFRSWKSRFFELTGVCPIAICGTGSWRALFE